MKNIKNFIINQFIPSHSNHMTNSSDLNSNWDFCKEFYGKFSLQLINFKKNDQRVHLPSKTAFRKIFLNYLNDPNNSSHFFKTQWVLSEYLTVGWKYPVQAVWNSRMRWWEIHPGYLRGLIYNLLEVQEWTAWYQPTSNRAVSCFKEFTSPDEITSYFLDSHHVSTHVVNYFNKPLMAICIHVSDNGDSTQIHKNIFQQNVQRGINIKGTDDIIQQVKNEVANWPNSYIKNQVVYDQDSFPSLTIEKFDKNNFYAGLYLFGSKVINFQQLNLDYRNVK